ncbi:MAG: YkgJ family cysteine cluster protein [Thermodesulfobacteriota bacterium]|nr:YkgJ family cysteine cluster protein [Thermodesulfobacteriota bacterium]
MSDDQTSNGPKAEVTPIRFGLDDTFTFECHKGVPCFTECCRGISIMLTPYDILRLKNRLGLPSDQFLAIYTEPRILERTDLPVVTLKLLDDDRQSCPFVKDGEGCIIYEDRPTTCRYYPLGVASLSHKEEDASPDGEGFYFFINEPHCKGFEENKNWTVEAWRKDQGVDIHDEINAEWTDLLVRKRSFPPNLKLTEEAKKMFFMASYDLDTFKRFVFESSFFERYQIDDETKKKIENDEIELMQFGFRWLKSILFKGEGDFQPKE